MASPSKIQRLDTFLTDFTEEVDTELKAVCYDISTKNSGQAIKAVEKIRRKLKAMEGKVFPPKIMNPNQLQQSKTKTQVLRPKNQTGCVTIFHNNSTLRNKDLQESNK
uniref:Uncharacterized protein n=1 Tax=Magallana gigas TaxID=29159 RepID=K1RB38_MAGGI